MARLLFSGSLVVALMACTYDVNVHGIPKSIEVTIPQLPGAKPPAESRLVSPCLPAMVPDEDDDGGYDGGDQ